MICLADFPYRALVDPLLTHLAGISKDFRGKEVFSVAFSVGMSTQRAPTRALKAFLLGLLVLVSCFQFLLVFPPPSGCLVALPGSLVVAGQVRKDGASPSTPPQTVGASGLRSSKPPVGTRGKGWLIRVDRLVENGKRA